LVITGEFSEVGSLFDKIDVYQIIGGKTKEVESDFFDKTCRKIIGGRKIKLNSVLKIFHLKKRDFKLVYNFADDYALEFIRFIVGKKYESGVDVFYFNVDKFANDFKGHKDWCRALITRPIEPLNRTAKKELEEYTNRRINEISRTFGYNVFYVFSPYKVRLLKKVVQSVFSDYRYYKSKISCGTINHKVLVPS